MTEVRRQMSEYTGQISKDRGHPTGSGFRGFFLFYWLYSKYRFIGLIGLIGFF
jgi:hypothetical protein